MCHLQLHLQTVWMLSGADGMARFPLCLNSAILVLITCDFRLVTAITGLRSRGMRGGHSLRRGKLRQHVADRPPAPVNVTVSHLKANSATVSWDVPEGDIIIGYAISQLRKDGQMQRSIREVNTTNRACVLWDLEEDTEYVIQVQSVGLNGESRASKRVQFRTLKETDWVPSNSSNKDDPTVQEMNLPLQTGEMIIIVTVLIMWAAVIALFCRQYDIIKDNDSSNNKEKTKPSSEHSTPEHPTGGLLRSKFQNNTPSINIIEV